MRAPQFPILPILIFPQSIKGNFFGLLTVYVVSRNYYHWNCKIKGVTIKTLFSFREVNITKFEKDSPADYSTSFKNNLSKTKDLEQRTDSTSIKKRSQSGSEKKEDNDVTDLTISGKAAAPATKSRSRKGISLRIITYVHRCKFM